MSVLSDWPLNQLLLALPANNLKRLMPSLEPIPCQEGTVLLDADSALDEVFFPDSGVVSVIAVYENGQNMEMATIGREGCTGFQAILGDQQFLGYLSPAQNLFLNIFRVCNVHYRHRFQLAMVGLIANDRSRNIDNDQEFQAVIRRKLFALAKAGVRFRFEGSLSSAGAFFGGYLSL